MPIAYTSPRVAVAIMLRVIFALTLRETHSYYGQLKIGYLWAFIETILFNFHTDCRLFSYARQVNSGPMALILYLHHRTSAEYIDATVKDVQGIANGRLCSARYALPATAWTGISSPITP